ncbi:MAG: FAD-dependent oxidoreductase [Candidatus Solibacter usitatus]|nr:FAD-dependent oxidoreductase [Candidatus Solibacter usitatus]
MRCDVAVIGGGVGGCAAALAAARNGLRVILTEETRWIGGQLTAQAVPPDEHRWIESFGATRAYREYRAAVRDYYRRHYPLTAEARVQPHLNPGGGGVSRLTHEPRVSLAVLDAMLAPHRGSGRLIVLTRHKPVKADVSGDRVRAVAVKSLESGLDRVISAAYFLDATELGDLLPLTGAEYVTGFESQKQTQEPHAPSEPQPHNMQAFTCCFAVDHLPGEDHTIDRPEEYAFWRDYTPALRPPWTGKLLDFSYSHPVTLRKRTLPFDPECDARGTEGGWWTYRRIARKRNFADDAYRGDITLVNWPQNDYLLGNLCEVSKEEAARHLRHARQLSLCLLYWLQTECGWPGLRLRPDIVGTEDGLAMSPYIRESRRILAEFTVLEQHVASDLRKERAENFRDSAGVGSYRIDLHPSTGGDNYIDIGSHPFQIPLGSLIPRRLENLLPAAKNLGVTHITNGCYRLHPVEWNTGESAGLLAAHAIQTRNGPRRIRNHEKLLREFQSRIQAEGVEISWPKLSE